MSQSNNSIIPISDKDKKIELRGEGMDCIANLIFDGHVRPIVVNGEEFGSLVDIVSVFKPKIKNPRQYWKDHKNQILSKDDGSGLDPELVANLYQLKIPAADGKSYKTDVAPLWVCVTVGLSLSLEFRKRMAKFTVAEIKYRMGNIARGSEWAADSIHKELTDGSATMKFRGDDPDLQWYQR